MAALIFAIPIVLTVLLIIIPSFALVSLITGLNMVLISELWVCITLAVVSVASTVVLLVHKPELGRTGRILLLIDLPLSLLTGLSLYNPQCGWVLLINTVSIVCVWVMCAMFVPDSYYKAVSTVVAVLISIAFAVMAVIGLVSDLISGESVVRTVGSPDGRYEAAVISEGGWFGDGMAVRIDYVKPELSLLLADFVREPKTVFEGEAHLIHTADIEWKDAETLLIEGAEYKAE